jgi:hypothetical protein
LARKLAKPSMYWSSSPSSSVAGSLLWRQVCLCNWFVLSAAALFIGQPLWRPDLQHLPSAHGQNTLTDIGKKRRA